MTDEAGDGVSDEHADEADQIDDAGAAEASEAMAGSGDAGGSGSSAEAGIGSADSGIAAAAGNEVVDSGPAAAAGNGAAADDGADDLGVADEPGGVDPGPAPEPIGASAATGAPAAAASSGHRGLSRRQFLAVAGGVGVAAVGGTILWSRLVDDQVSEHTASHGGGKPSGRILVVLEIAGGNDGLNTLVPSSPKYRDARPTLGIPEHELVALHGRTDYSLHPSLAPLAPLYAAGNLSAIQSIGFHDATRSHFAEMDRWHAGGGDNSWLGRWLDATAGAHPTPLRAIALGTDTRTLAAARSVSTVVSAPDTFQLIAPHNRTTDGDAVLAAFKATAAPLSSDPQFAAAQQAIPATLDAVHVFEQATQGAPPEAPQEPGAPTNKAQRYFSTAAQLIALDVGAEVIVVGIDGFDTHSAQADHHAQLLDDLAKGFTSFTDAMKQQGRADDVLIVTTSEFGRRVAQNGSLGTDHGKANVMFLHGTSVSGDFVGDLGLNDIDDEGDMPVEIDTRSLYANALDWLGGPTDDILGDTFDRYGLVRA